VDASDIPHPGWNMLHFDGATRVRVEGITLINAANWNFVIGRSADIAVHDVRIISGRLNSDGINSVNSRQVTISDCFVRNHDDSIVVKTTRVDAPAEDITVTNNVIWNDWGYALGVSYETRSPIRRILFRGNDILYARHWCLGVHLSDGATVEDIRFEDTTVSDLASTANDNAGSRAALSHQPMILKADITKDVWGHDEERGHIRNVTIDGLVVYGDRWWPSIVKGYDADHIVDGLLWRDCRLAGQPPFRDLAPLHINSNEHVRDMRIESATAE
jgi:polygalacturonase